MRYNSCPSRIPAGVARSSICPAMVAGHKKGPDMRINKITRGLAPVVLFATPATLVFGWSSFDECRNNATYEHGQCDQRCDSAFPNGGCQHDDCLQGCSIQEQIDAAQCEDEFEWC